MPLNEAESFRYSTLTTQQKAEAMKSIYGLAEGPTSMTPAIPEMSFEERIKLRRLLDSMDQKEAGTMKEFDLNKPPVAPYVYSEYPFLMYDHESRTMRAARNYDERQQMLAQGWSEEAYPADPPVITLSASDRAEAQEIDKQLVKKKR